MKVLQNSKKVLLVDKEANKIAPTQMSLGTLFSWVKKGGFAVLDQGLFTGANFVVHILLARWLEPAQYGAFAVAYSMFLLLASFHTAMLTEPMLIFGAGKYTQKFSQYLGLLLYSHWGVTSGIAVFLTLTAVVFWSVGSQEMVQALAGLAVAAPFILVLWLMRQAFYVQAQPQWAAAGGVAYITLMTAGMYVLYVGNRLSVPFALMVMGLASFVVSIGLSRLLHPEWRLTGRVATLRMILTDHWQYGRWASATAALAWTPNLYYLILPVWGGLEGSATLRAMMNLVLPILRQSSAIATLLLPQFVRVLDARGQAGLQRLVSLALVGFVTGALCYAISLFVFREEVLGLLYGSRYSGHTDLLLIIGLLPLIDGVSKVIGQALRAMGSINLIFRCSLVETLLILTLGLWFLTVYQVRGAIVGLLIAAAVKGGGMMWFYLRNRKI